GVAGAGEDLARDRLGVGEHDVLRPYVPGARAEVAHLGRCGGGEVRELRGGDALVARRPVGGGELRARIGRREGHQSSSPSRKAGLSRVMRWRSFSSTPRSSRISPTRRNASTGSSRLACPRSDASTVCSGPSASIQSLRICGSHFFVPFGSYMDTSCSTY